MRTGTVSDVVDSASPKLLVVSDSASHLAWLREILSSKYFIYASSDAQTAFSLAKDVSPDLILTDAVVSDAGSGGLCRWIKEDETLRHIPVAVFASEASEEERMSCYRSGADIYITNPAGEELVLAVVGNMISTRKAFQNRRLKVDPSSIRKVKAYVPRNVVEDDKTFLEGLRLYIENNISVTSINVTALAGEMCMSRASFFRKMKSLTGMTPNDFILSYRLNKAVSMLVEGKWRIGEIADMLGFSSASHFSRVFRQKFGKSPKEFSL